MNTRVGCHALLQEIFLTQQLNWGLLCLLHYQVGFLPLAPPGKAFTSFSQFGSVAQSCLTLCNPMNHSTPGLPVHHQLPEFTQTQSIESVMPSSHLILCRPLLFLPSLFHSIRVFSNELALHIRWPNYSSFSISLSNEYSGLISFRIDWFDLLAVQFR